jgi:hypothetical protein
MTKIVVRTVMVKERDERNQLLLDLDQDRDHVPETTQTSN